VLPVAIGISAVAVVVISALYVRSRRAEQAKLRRDNTARPSLQGNIQDLSSAKPSSRRKPPRPAPMVLQPTPAARASRQRPAPPPAAGGETVLPDPQVGDRVALFPEAQARSQLRFIVRHRHRYEIGGEEWYEVTGKVDGREVFVEVWGGQDPGVAAGFTGELALDQAGLTEDMLVGYDERPQQTPPFEFSGSRWLFRISGEVMFYKNCGRQAAGCYYWKFDEENGRRILHVEKWEGKPFVAGVCTRLKPGEIHVSRK